MKTLQSNNLTGPGIRSQFGRLPTPVYGFSYALPNRLEFIAQVATVGWDSVRQRSDQIRESGQ